MRKLLFLISLFFLCSNQLYSQEDINNREAKYRSGEHAFKDFLSQTIKYPVYAQEKNKQGQIIINFTVSKNGNLKNFTAVKQFDKECTNQVIKALRMSPKWLPKIKNGKPINSKQTVIIFFKLRGADTRIDIEPKEDDIIIWGYGTTKKKTLCKC